jgi:RNA polymerase primary sigma factor
MNRKFVNSNEDDSITKYFREIRKTEILTPEQETNLAIRIQNGDEVAIEELVTANLKFVISIAKDYQGQGLSLGDLISEGNYGLIKAAMRFDHTRGFRFISYAVYWIKQAIMLSLNDNSREIRLPANVINKLYKIRKQIEKFELINERTPVTGDAVVNKNGEEENYEELGPFPTCGSLSSKISEDGAELLEVIPDNTFDQPDIFEVDSDKLKVELYKTLEVLDDREKNIIECYYGLNTECEPMTLEAIGDKYELTKERIRQIKEKAIRKLRHNIHNLHEINGERN